MKKIRIRFVDYARNDNPKNGLAYQLISRHFEIDDCGAADYAICFGQGLSHVQYDSCVKILMQGENSTPNFNDYDYAVGFDHLDFGDRYLRMPLYPFWRKPFLMLDECRMKDPEILLRRKFCSFVVSNAAFGDPMRQKFFERLSKYKKVDSGGRWMNNVGGPVKDKLDFCRGYKFNIAFENSAYDGYTTEKIMEAYAAESVPIYFGNPTIETDFRLESMVRVKDESDIERAVEEVIRLDNDDAAYLAKCRERCFAVSDPMVYERELEAFLVHIFEQPLEQARRRARYGHQAMMREHMRKLMKLDQWIGKARQVLHV